jgi:tetratricopeptide (TPR) repeat protein
LLARPPIVLALIALSLGCGVSSDRSTSRTAAGAGARVGTDPVPSVQLFENHGSSLIAWRRAGVRDRVLVHVDGHSDLDWLPDAAVARIAAADPDELASLELHPYVLDGTTHRRFGIWDFVYPAARLGIVRRFVWVVPDGTLATPQLATELVQRLILGKMQMIELDEAKTLKLEGRRIRGRVLGLDLTICELADLPSFDEPVLLDIDLDFLTTRSGTTQEVTAWPWITPDQLVGRLRERGVRTELATLSLSTMGGYLPPACRWVGPAAVAALAGTSGADGGRWDAHAAADAKLAVGHAEEAAAIWRDLVARFPDDAPAWYALSRENARAGRAGDARASWDKAIAADPVLVDAALFEADGLWMNQRYDDALGAYRAYRRQRPQGPFLAYVLRREAGCLMRVGRDDDAIATLRKVVALAPDHGDTRLDLGLLLRSRGDVDGALAELREARRILPEQGTYAMALGMTYARMGNLDAALAELTEAAALRPTWTQAQANLGLLLIEAGRPVDAAEHLDAAAMLEPGNPRIDRVLARLRRQGITTATTPVADRRPAR